MKVNWIPRINKLMRIKGKKQAPTLAEMEFRAEANNDAGNWGCCSVAQKMLKIEDGWERLNEYDRQDVLKYEKNLYNLGVRFSMAIIRENYITAKETHKQIQHYKLDELNMALRIRTEIPN